MRKKQMRDHLSRQTDLILDDEAYVDDSIDFNKYQDDQLASLLELAAALKETLVPLTNPSLKTRVGDTLANYSQPDVLLRRANKVPLIWIGLAVTGSVISFLSVIILLLRKVKLSNQARVKPRIFN